MSQATIKTFTYFKSKSPQGLERLVLLYRKKTGVLPKIVNVTTHGEYLYAWYYGDVAVKIERPKATKSTTIDIKDMSKQD